MYVQEYFFNLTRTNNITIAARDSDSSKSFEVRPTDNIIVRLSPPTQGGGAHISISGFRENVNYTVRFQFNNTNELRNASDQFTLCKINLLSTILLKTLHCTECSYYNH